MEMPEKVRSSAGYNSGEAYYRADEMDAYLADCDADLRDEVAMAAMQGMLAYYGHLEHPDAIVNWAFDLSDAFMSERARRREGR